MLLNLFGIQHLELPLRLILNTIIWTYAHNDSVQHVISIFSSAGSCAFVVVGVENSDIEETVAHSAPSPVDMEEVVVVISVAHKHVASSVGVAIIIHRSSLVDVLL